MAHILQGIMTDTPDVRCDVALLWVEVKQSPGGEKKIRKVM